MSKLSDLTPEQAKAIEDFKVAHGPRWKSKLNAAWMSGDDAREPNGHLLRQVRNQKGPRWLDTLVT